MKIEVRELSKRYGDTLAVDGLSFTVEPGRVTGFLGPNGAGKSTTMRLILGLDRPSRGAATIDGHRYRELPVPLGTVGALLEARAVHTGRSAYHHLLVLAQTQGIPSRRVREVIELVGLESAASRRAGTFSLGMGQRLGIAAALLGDPRVLILDEPVNGLDPEGIVWIRTLMKRLAAKGRTIFVSSHLMGEIANTAEHLVVIGRGKLIADCATDEFIEQNSEQSVLVRSPDLGRLKELVSAGGARVLDSADGAISVFNLPAARIGELAAQEGVVLHELAPQRASLEEAFMELTRDSLEYAAPSEAAGQALSVDAISTTEARPT
ncbi:MAG: type transport system ATP-binding protein [Nocardioidaceae bacterium]|jgi:ABC-2 type transport system ATP-binding protein|nr:type transport system ATP-binding protein [Nocardioidaceae bacterium]